LGLAFFGLTPDSAKQHRVNFLTQIHEICFHGQGGYRWQEVYDMPLWLRKFTFQKIKEFYEKRNEEVKKSQGNSSVKEVIGADGMVKSPDFFKKTSYK